MAYHDAVEEVLGPEAIRQAQRARLAAMLAEIRASNPFWQRKLGDSHFDPRIDSMNRLPLSNRREFETSQQQHPPYGDFLTYPLTRYNRFHQTSGSRGTPLSWLDTGMSWDWWMRCWSVIYRAAGLTDGEPLVFPFSFGPFIGFWGAFEAASRLGNLCLPAGGMTTVARLKYLIDNRAAFVCCTPTYALHMAGVAEDEGIALKNSAVRGLIVAGEPGGNIPSIRGRIESAWGARVFDHAGLTEVGPWGFECAENPGGLHVLETEFIAEVIDPESLASVEDGHPGELVLTNLGRWGSPVIRYRTGDRVILTRGRCACGRWFARVEGGIGGRLDDMLIIRGNNVFPSSIEGIVREFDDVAEFRMVVGSDGSMTRLRIDVEPCRDVDADSLVDRLSERVRDRLHFRPEIALVEPGSLPRYELKARRLIKKGT